MSEVPVSRETTSAAATAPMAAAPGVGIGADATLSARRVAVAKAEPTAAAVAAAGDKIGAVTPAPKVGGAAVPAPNVVDKAAPAHGAVDTAAPVQDVVDKTAPAQDVVDAAAPAPGAEPGLASSPSRNSDTSVVAATPERVRATKPLSPPDTAPPRVSRSRYAHDHASSTALAVGVYARRSPLRTPRSLFRRRRSRSSPHTALFAGIATRGHGASSAASAAARATTDSPTGARMPVLPAPPGSRTTFPLTGHPGLQPIPPGLPPHMRPPSAGGSDTDGSTESMITLSPRRVRHPPALLPARPATRDEVGSNGVQNGNVGANGGVQAGRGAEATTVVGGAGGGAAATPPLHPGDPIMRTPSKKRARERSDMGRDGDRSAAGTTAGPVTPTRQRRASRRPSTEPPPSKRRRRAPSTKSASRDDSGAMGEDEPSYAVVQRTCLREGCNSTKLQCKIPRVLVIGKRPNAKVCQKCFFWLRRHFHLDLRKHHKGCRSEHDMLPHCREKLATFRNVQFRSGPVPLDSEHRTSRSASLVAAAKRANAQAASAARRASAAAASATRVSRSHAKQSTPAPSTTPATADLDAAASLLETRYQRPRASWGAATMPRPAAIASKRAPSPPFNPLLVMAQIAANAAPQASS